MALTTEHINCIVQLDEQGKQIMRQGGEEALLMSLGEKMSTIREIMDASSEIELNQYCEQYTGFYQYMKLLERLAKGCAGGVFDGITG